MKRNGAIYRFSGKRSTWRAHGCACLNVEMAHGKGFPFLISVVTNGNKWLFIVIATDRQQVHYIVSTLNDTAKFFIKRKNINIK